MPCLTKWLPIWTNWHLTVLTLTNNWLLVLTDVFVQLKQKFYTNSYSVKTVLTNLYSPFQEKHAWPNNTQSQLKKNRLSSTSRIFVIIISKLINCHSKANCRAPDYSRTLSDGVFQRVDQRRPESGFQRVQIKREAGQLLRWCHLGQEELKGGG